MNEFRTNKLWYVEHIRKAGESLMKQAYYNKGKKTHQDQLDIEDSI
jgi:hypothetical protein